MERAKYSWENPYLAAVLETDQAKLHELVQAAQARIDNRIQELAVDGDGGSEEQKALDAAVRGLDLLRKERLGIGSQPAPPPSSPSRLEALSED